MEKKDTNILIISGLIFLLSIGIIYFLVWPTYKQIGVQDDQIKQINEQIQARTNYYSTVEAKVKKLEEAGWAEKKKKIEVNFTDSPFFISKMNVFFKTMIASAGMTSAGITASPATSVKTAPQAAQSGSGAKISTSTGSTEQTTVQQTTSSSSYFDKLQGSVKKTTFNIAVSGTYNSFKKLLSDLENQTRIVTVKSVAVASSQQEVGKKVTNLSNFNLVVDVYSY